ncbi:MAG: hypothetical protein AAF264_08060, partial [Pseudomonadota bacterium]
MREPSLWPDGLSRRTGPGAPSQGRLRDRLPPFVSDNYECHEWRHASAILSQDFPAEWADIMDVLTDFRLRRSWIAVGGGS